MRTGTSADSGSNLARQRAGRLASAATARRAGLFVDASELGRPAVSITVTGG